MKCPVQKWISFFLHDTPCGQGWVQRHLERCPACHDYLEAQLKLAQALKSQATELRQSAPAFLKIRVMASLPSPQFSTERSPIHPLASHPGFTTTSFAFVLACSLVTAILLWRDQPAPPAPADLHAMAKSWLERGTNEMAMLTTIQLPLEKEMGYVLSDAKSALLAVADGVLPSGVLPNP
jgi:hypothetical protein